MSFPVKIDWSKVAKPPTVLARFPSRRSVVYGTKGIVSSSQPLATEAGLEILRKGGNAGAIHCSHPHLITDQQLLFSGRGRRDLSCLECN